MYQIFFNKERKKNIKREKNLGGISLVEAPIQKFPNFCAEIV